MIHIEFSGVPGSGKTFVCTSIARKLRARRVPVITNSEGLAEAWVLFRTIKKIGTITMQILLHPVWTLCVLNTIITSRQSSIKGMFRSFFTITHVSGTIRKYKKKDVFVMLDQGSIQAFFSLLYGARNTVQLPVERILPVPDILLETDSPDTVLMARLVSRTRVQSRVEKDGITGIQRSREVLALIRNSYLYHSIPNKIGVPDERPESVLQDLADAVQERNSHE